MAYVGPEILVADVVLYPSRSIIKVRLLFLNGCNMTTYFQVNACPPLLHSRSWCRCHIHNHDVVVTFTIMVSLSHNNGMCLPFHIIIVIM